MKGSKRKLTRKQKQAISWQKPKAEIKPTEAAALQKLKAIVNSSRNV